MRVTSRRGKLGEVFGAAARKSDTCPAGVRALPSAKTLPMGNAEESEQAMLASVRPAGWVNPRPADRYNLVVIGAGTAGLVSAAAAAALGAKVALVERERMGGDCLNYGCVPSKALIRSARAAAEVRGAGRFGVAVDGAIGVEFGAVMARMRRLRAELSRNDSADRFTRLGVDLFFGTARFSGADRVAVEGATLRFRRAIIATGSRPRVPAIPGLQEAGYLTNETIFSLAELPRRLAVIGGGPLGCELAQAFARFGSKVTLVEAASRVLPQAEPEASEIVARALARDGVALMAGRQVIKVVRRGAEKAVELANSSGQEKISAGEILIGTGREAAIEDLDPEAAHVAYDKSTGIKVDDFLRTSNRRIYAAGDVATAARFTHTADAAARIAVSNALFGTRRRFSALVPVSVVYTSPEVAQAGLGVTQAKSRALAVQTWTQPFREVDRALIDDETDGLVKLTALTRRGRLVGATIVGEHAGETVSELALAIAVGARLADLARLVHPYPTQAEAIRKAADAYYRSRLTPGVRRLLERFFRLLR